ncbi:MAG: glycosyltransferase family 39 protein [Gemmatimonadaceae bacterium]
MPLAIRWIAGLALAVLIAHVVVNALTPYGYHRDEFLYMAMGRHLRVWRMDFPPFIAMLSQATRATFGDSLVALRLGPAAAGAGVVVMAALIAREMGGDRFAQALAAFAVATCPLFLRAAALFQPVVFDQLWWTMALFVLARLARDAPWPNTLSVEPKWWLALGVVCGVAVLTKFSALLLGAAMAAGLVLSPQRRTLLTRWPWAAAMIALAIGSPSLVGQARLGFPVVGQMGALQHGQLAHVSVWSFVGEQFLWGPSTLLAFAGAVYLLRAVSLRRFRPVGWTCVIAFAILLAVHGKSYYIGAAYPTWYAAGATALSAWTGARRRPARAAVRASSVVVLAAFVALVLPFCLPILPPKQMAEFGDRSGIAPATRTNMGVQLQLPQDYADMLGWREEIAAVAHVVDSLPAPARAALVVIGQNYGEAGALDFYGPRFGLPRAVSGAGSYWFFGPGDKPGAVAVTIGVARADLERFDERVTPAGRVRNAWGVPEESDVPIFVAEGPRTTLQRLWPSLAGRN